MSTHLFPLSAREESVLRIMVAELLEFLGENPEASLESIAYTLQVGREQMEVRLAIEADSSERLLSELSRLLASSEALGTSIKGKDRQGLGALASDDDMKQLVEGWMAKRALRKLADAWLAGFKIDWNLLYTEQRPRRANLPAYPFKQQRYWITESRGAKPAAVAAAAAVEPRGSDLFGQASAREADPVVARPAPREPEPAVAMRLREPEPMMVPPVPPAAVLPATVGKEITLGELQDELSRGLASALFMDENDIDLDETFFELGVESVSGVEWIRELTQRYGITLKVSAIYDFPTLRTFAEFLYEKLSQTPAGLFREIGEAAPAPVAIAAPVEPAVVAEPPPKPVAAKPAAAAMDGDDPALGAEIAALLRDLSEILGVDAAALDADQTFDEMGLTTATVPQLLRGIGRRHDVKLLPAEVYAAGTPRALGRHVNGIAPRAREAVATVSVRGMAICGPALVDEMKLVAWPLSSPRAGEVTIAVAASGVNFADAMCVTGLYPTIPEYPFVAGLEVAGRISAVGANVAGFAVGDEVVAVTGAALGGHASSVNVAADNVVAKPRNLTFEEAASLPVAFLTMRAAFETARLGEGQTLLMHTATGGCGMMAIQLARLMGCTLYASTSKHDKRWKLKLIGIDEAVDYNQAFEERIRAWTGGRGVDVVVNTVAGPAMQRGLDSLAPGGRYVELAVHAQKSARDLDLSGRDLSVHGIDLGRLRAGEGAGRWLSDALAQMVRMAEAGEIVPIVSRVYAGKDIAQAIKCVSLGEHVGKVVVSHEAAESVNCEDVCLKRMDEQRQAASRRRSPASDAVASPGADTRRSRTAAPHAPVVPEGVAVIGMVGQFPMAASPAEFWRNLEQGRYCVSGLPYERWKMPRPENGSSPLYPHTGVLEDADTFDPLFFNISPKEARLMDPQQRVFLQNCWSCIEDAGYAPSSLSGSRCGVFAGCSGAGYGFGRIQETSTHVLMGHTNSILPARISYHLNLKGPCMAIDTACSSALVAVAEACTSLAFGGCDLALAGGVSIFASPIFSKMAAEGGMLSEDGRCYTFDKRANGFVPAEGVGVFLLKRLSDALRDGDRIHGVVSGWGVNHDGKTNGMTAPSVASQTALECEVYEKFAIHPETISYIEAHGTGTRLGDPIEVQGLTDAFRGFTAKTGYCALGSVKTNIGHALAAAAAAGMLKVLLSLRHRVLPPSINYESLNDEITLDGTPFYVNATAQPWRSDGPLRAAVSSFSYNGTNAHVVIEEAPPGARAVAAEETQLILISARSEQQLEDQIRQLLAHVEDFLGRSPSRSDKLCRLGDIAYTLQLGRDAMVERLAFACDSLEQLESTLRDVLGGRAPKGLARANVRGARKKLDKEDREAAARRAAAIEAALAAGDRAALIEQWMAGAAVDWRGLTRAAQPQRMSLPTYPFARKRYWFDDVENAPPAEEKRAEPAPVPKAALDLRFEQLLGKLNQNGSAGAASFAP
ncbi:MAG: zinc-binding dehydrogenase [Alphaproteobacteria bacterium]|nr:zinc-binding dehydrogenase [Alphaproteobacteria bacterium]